MKYFNVGENAEYLIEMKLTKQQGKFGAMYYFEKIQLATTVPVCDYNVWQNKDGQQHLCIRHKAGLKEELEKIVAAIKKKHDTLIFKDLDVEAMYFKVKPVVSNTIPLNQKVNVTIQIYGVFNQKSNNTAYLQMEVVEVKV